MNSRKKWQKLKATSQGSVHIASLTATISPTHHQPPLQNSGVKFEIWKNDPSSLLRRCDSRNLNLSPFCGVDSSSAPLKLQPTLEESYGSKSVGYVQDLPSPMRKEYPLQSMASDEILSPLAKVWPPFFSWKSFTFQDDPEYNAFERDIAVVNLFFPDSTVFGQYIQDKLTHTHIS